MTADIGAIVVAAVMAGEVGLLAAGAYALFRDWSFTLAEAAGCGIISAFMFLSFLLQCSFILGGPVFFWAPEAVALLTAVFVWRKHAALVSLIRSVAAFSRSHRSVRPLALVLLVLGLMSLILPTSLAPWTGFPGRPVNHAVLPYLFLRFDVNVGPDLFGFLAYLSAGFSTYALARRYAWPPTAFTSAMVVLGMPRLVWQTTTYGPEIIPAATALCCLVCVYRLVEKPEVRDLVLLTYAIPFTLSANPLGGAIPAILLPLAAVILYRRHGALIWRSMIAGNRMVFLLALAPVVVFSQIWLFIGNAVRGGPWMAPAAGIVPNSDGLQGAAANAIRYFLESAHFIRPLDWFCQWAFDFRPTGILQWLHKALVVPLFDGAGTALPFHVVWTPNGPLSGFGPFAFLLILPAVAWSLIRGNRRIKTIALALVGYAYIVTIAVAWMDGNEQFFTFFYACGGFCAAFLLPPWRLTRPWKQGLQFLCLVLMGYVAAAELAAVFQVFF